MSTKKWYTQTILFLCVKKVLVKLAKLSCMVYKKSSERDTCTTIFSWWHKTWFFFQNEQKINNKITRKTSINGGTRYVPVNLQVKLYLQKRIYFLYMYL